MKRKQAYQGILHPLVFKWTGLPMAFLFLTLSTVTHAQVPQNTDSYEIRGQVLSGEDDSPLPSVTVQIQGSLTGVSTDENGEFTMAARNSHVTISFSYLGYRTLDTALALPLLSPLVVKLKQDAAMLDETVVIGYGTTTRRLNTGSVGRVTAEEIGRQPVGNLLLALQGRVPGLEVTQTSGLPGREVRVLIRGRNSIESGNEPLFIVDGVPWLGKSLSQISGSIGGQSPFNSINPSDIQSVEVLKDADATAIYGSRGANGVILITTKKGREGKTRVDVNVYEGRGRVTRSADLMDTRQYLAMRREALANDGLSVTEENAPDLLLYDTVRYTNWKKLLIGNTARVTDARVSLSGGNESTRFRLAGSYRRETTVFPGDLADKRGAAQVNVSHGSADRRFQGVVSAGYSSNENELIPTDLTGLIYTAPNQAVYNADGSLAWSERGSTVYNNPLGVLLRSFSSVTNSLTGNMNLSYEVFRGLRVRVSGGYANTGMRETRVHPRDSYMPSVTRASGDSRFGNSDFSSWIVEPQLNYTGHLGKGKLDVLIGASWQQERNEGRVIEAHDYSSEALLHSTAGAATITTTASYNLYRYQAVFGRINYRYAGKYLLNLTGRRDGSSRFGPGRQYAGFGAAGAGWIFSEERAVKEGLPFLSFGKLRGSYGITGNDRIGDYQFMDTYGAASYPYQGTSGLVPQRLFNPGYGWETNKKMEAALDLGFFRDRLLVSTSWFRNRSGNQLVNYTLPLQTGFSGITRNLPALVQNKGWEIELSTVPLLDASLYWESSFNITIARNKLLEFPGLESSSYAAAYAIGEPLNIEKLYRYIGVDPNTGIWQVNLEAGRYVIQDLTTRYYGGWSNILRYKNLELAMFIQFSAQDAPAYLATLPGTPGYMGHNQPLSVLDRWQQEGDVTDVQRFFAVTGEASVARTNYRNSDAAYTDASYVRLKNLSFSCSLPDSWFQKLSVEHCRLYLLGQNLLTVTSFEGNDPEVPYAGSLPPLRMLTMGIQMAF